jgi:hypothetical protein
MAAAPSASLPLLRAPFGSDNPAAQGLWVKIQSSSLTSDGGACGRRNLLGDVVSRDTARPRICWPTVRGCFGWWGRGCCRVGVVGVCLPLAMTLLSCWRLDVFTRLPIVCLQRPSALGIAWQSPVPVGWRLRHRWPVKTWLAAGRGGIFSMAECSRCGASSQEGASDTSDPPT